MTSRLLVAVAALAGVLGVARTAHAYRPFVGTDAAVAATGEIELEIGPIGYLREGKASFLTAPDLVVNLGVLPRIELVAEGVGMYSLDARRGEARAQLADTGMFFKAVLREGALQDGDGPSIAFEGGSLFPSAPEDKAWGFEGTLIVSQRWKVGTLHVNIAGARTRAGEGEGFLSAILEGPDPWKVRPVVEAYYDRELHAAQTWSLLCGAIWRIREELSLDAASRWAREGATNAFEIRAGLTWAFQVWGR